MSLCQYLCELISSYSLCEIYALKVLQPNIVDTIF